MRVVQVNFYLASSGRSPEAWLDQWPTLTQTAQATAEAGCSVRVVQASTQNLTLERGPVTYDFVEIPAWPFGRSVRGNRWLRGFARLSSLVRGTNPDIVHVHGLTAPVQVGLMTRVLSDVPVLAQDHASHPPVPLRRWVHKWGFSRLSGVAFTAREQADPFLRTGILPNDLPVFEVIEASSTFTPGDREVARRTTGIFGDPCLLWVGRLDGNKDPITVLDAVDRVIPELPGIRLWCLYTDAPLLEAVERRLDASQRLKDSVRLVGEASHTEVEAFYRAADLFTLASHAEGSGYALLEALACGLCPLVTSIPSFRRITRGGVIGELFQPGDSSGLAEGIVKLARENRSRMRDRVRRYFETELSYEAIGKQWRHAYEAVRTRP